MRSRPWIWYPSRNVIEMYSSNVFASVVGLEHIVSSLQGKYFPLADEPSPDDLAALNVEDRVGVRAVATGEFRPPRKGEWFLSGSYIKPFRAESDLPTAYNIAKLAYV